MSFLLQPWHILLVTVAVLVNQRQQQIIEFQNAQIEALLKKLGKKCLLRMALPAILERSAQQRTSQAARSIASFTDTCTAAMRTRTAGPTA
ncbi:MAG: hypothetical protein ACKVHE_37460 [Planctomycetales bacterium]|jgi:hypothetical protein